jgi:adenylate cyclase
MGRTLRRNAIVAILIAVTAAMIAVSPAFGLLNGASIDALTALRWLAFGPTRDPASSPVVVVAIDEETYRIPPFAGTPNVTWTPEIGRVLTAVVEGGAKVVGFDIVFSTSIEQSEMPFGDETLGAKVRGFDREFLRALALASRSGKVVLGQMQQHQEYPNLPSLGQRFAVGQGSNIRALNVDTDRDGIVRRLPLTFSVDGATVPSMAVELAARALGVAPQPEPNGTMSLGEYRIPAAVPNTMTLNFEGGSDDVPTYSLADLRACAEKGDTDFFRRHFGGKVVLIGTVLDAEDRKLTSKRFATAPEGARAERCALLAQPAANTFVRDSISGVYVHATAVNNLIHRDALTEFGFAGGLTIAIIFAALIAAAGTGPFPRRRDPRLFRSCRRVDGSRHHGSHASAGASAGRAAHRGNAGARRHDRLSLCHSGPRQALIAPELRTVSRAGGHREADGVAQAAGARWRVEKYHGAVFRRRRFRVVFRSDGARRTGNLDEHVSDGDDRYHRSARRLRR